MRKEVVAGIDVSAKTLEVSVEEVDGKIFPLRSFDNSPTGHKDLCRWLTQGGRKARVVLESTGVYSLPLALALNGAQGIDVMVANPKAVKDFAGALMQRSKSDTKDATSIREFAKRMPFVPWEPPSEEILELQQISRRLAAMTVDKTRESNRLHAMKARGKSSKFVINDIEVNLRHLERRIELLQTEALRHIASHPDLERAFKRVTSVKGIAAVSAVQILGEILVLPKDMTVGEWVAHCGLDPREYTSGKSVKRPTRISKVGNVNLRRALYMPALVAVVWEPHVKAFYEKLLSRDKEKLEALVAVMRKLLHAIYGMLKHDTDFCGEKFCALHAHGAQDPR
ncbi:MAG: IS110 family transposase [Candidatus Binatia bacterium]